eukprot:365844-Chlamydomonas_euryale.AAC.4
MPRLRGVLALLMPVVCVRNPTGRCMNLAKVMALRPQLLLKPIDAIQRDADGVKQLLATAKDVDKLMEAVPTLMNPKLLLSVLVTVNKW